MTIAHDRATEIVIQITEEIPGDDHDDEGICTCLETNLGRIKRMYEKIGEIVQEGGSENLLVAWHLAHSIDLTHYMMASLIGARVPEYSMSREQTNMLKEHLRQTLPGVQIMTWEDISGN